MNNVEKNNFSEKKESWYEIDTSKLLSELSEDISKDFGINEETAKQLTELKTENGLEWLKFEITKSNISEEQKELLNNFWDEKLEKLFFTIKWTIDNINKASQNKLDVLKSEIDSSSFKPNTSWIKTKLSKNIISKIENPKNIWDNIIWASVWAINSLQKTVETLYNIWKWIIQTPYDLYTIIKWDAEIKDIKKV